MDSWPTGIGRRTLDIVDSTNAEGRRAAAELDRPTWIMARMQTAGRGRLGRPWFSSLGNFSASLVIPAENRRSASLRTFAAALALRDACVELAGGAGRFKLKWPNDLLLNRGKLAGILLECVGETGSLHLIIGFGVNLASAPNIIQPDGGSPHPVSLVGETGVSVSPEDFLARLARSFQLREDQFRKDGFPSVRSDWLNCASGLGANVNMRTADRTVSGTFEGIGSDGAAILRVRGEQVSIAAGDMILVSGESHAPDN